MEADRQSRPPGRLLPGCTACLFAGFRAGACCRLLARVPALFDFWNLQRDPEDMRQKVRTQEYRFTTKFPHPALNRPAAKVLAKADRSVLHPPGQHAPVLSSEQHQFYMGMSLEPGLYAVALNHGFFVSALSRDSGSRPRRCA